MEDDKQKRHNEPNENYIAYRAKKRKLFDENARKHRWKSRLKKLMISESIFIHDTMICPMADNFVSYRR